MSDNLRKELLADLENLTPEKLQRIRQEIENRVHTSDYTFQRNLVFLLSTLFHQIERLFKDLTTRPWDVQSNEMSLDNFFYGLSSLRKTFQEFFPQKKFPYKIFHIFRGNKIFQEFLIRKKEFAFLKELNPSAFDLQLKIYLVEIESIPHFDGDEERFYKTIQSLHAMRSSIEHEEKFYSSLVQVMSSTHISIALFLKLLPLIPSEMHSSIRKIKFKQWINSFFKGLNSGELSHVFNSVAELVNKEYFEFLKTEIQHYPEIHPYMDTILLTNPKHFLQLGLWRMCKMNLDLRLGKLKGISSEIKQNIEHSKELGLAIRKLKLIEKGSSHFPLIKAIELQDLELLKTLMKELEIEPWDKLENGETLLGVAALLTMLDRERFTESFFYSFHQYTRQRWSELKLPWKMVLEFFLQTAYRSNNVCIQENSIPFLGKWNSSETLYDNLLKIYLPESEWEDWKKYCSEPSFSGESQWLELWRRNAYRGSQQIYGRWFHLCSKVALESIQEGIGWNELLRVQGYYRKVVALLLANVQVPRDHFISIITRMQQVSFSKEWPGSPLNFGLPIFSWEPSYTTLTIKQRSYYENWVREFLREFYQKYPPETLQEGNYTFSNRDIQVVKNGQGKGYAITVPLWIQNETLVATHILWNWPARTPYFFKDEIPFFYDSDHLGMWVHPSGETKIKIEKELSRLYPLLLQKNPPLARFFYLFAQSMPFRRGSAAVGLILLNAFLRFHGKEPPNALPDPRFLDCEAMCATEEEFSHIFNSVYMRGREKFA